MTSARPELDGPATPDPPQGLGRWLVLASIATGTFMANVDSTAVTVALPTMAREFDAGLDALQWVLLAYLLAITAVLPVFGRLADIVGRKPVLNLGLALFVLSSLVVALAPTLPVLIAFRALQGIGASMFMATITATAVTIFPAHQRGRVLGLLGSVVAAGTFVGPAVGGLLTEAFGWRAIFVINVPIGLLGVAGTLAFLPRERGTGGSRRDLDLTGAVLFAAFAACLVLGVGSAPGAAGSPAVVGGLLATTAVLLVLFVLWELRLARPLIDLRLFRRRVFGLGNVAGLLYYGLTVFAPFLFPLYLIEVRDLSAGQTGLLMTLPALTMLVIAPLSGWWSDRVGSQVPALCALSLLVLTMSGTAALGPTSPVWLAGGLLALLGAALGTFSSPNISAVMGAVARHEVGMANGIVATVRNLGRALGITLVVLVYGAFAGTTATARASQDALLSGFRGAFLVGAGIAAGAFAAIVMTYRQRREDSEPRRRGRRLTPAGRG